MIQFKQRQVGLVLIVEKGFIGADDFGILFRALANATAQIDDSVYTIGRQEGVADRGLLADTVDAACTVE